MSVTVMWEKRFKVQVSVTEEAMLAKRNAEISLRETERLLQESRSDTVQALAEIRDLQAAISATGDSSAALSQGITRQSTDENCVALMR